MQARTALVALVTATAPGCLTKVLPPPTVEETCLAAPTWRILGLAPEQVPEQPDQLLKARLRVGDIVPLHAAVTGHECGTVVTAVSWRSGLSEVAAVTRAGVVDARLEALSPGETAVWADVTLSDGTVRRAEVYATPSGRSSPLRVWAVVVSR